MAKDATPYLLFIDDYARPTIGGGERHVLHLARAAREWGWRVGIVCTAGSGFERAVRREDFEVWPVNMGRGRLFVRQRLQAVFAHARPDIVHIHGFLAMMSAAPAARRAGVPHVLATVHNMPSAPLALRPGIAGRMEFKFRACAFRRIARLLDAYICVVNAAADELAALGVPREQLLVIPNGIPDPHIALKQPQLLPPFDDDVLVGSVGRLENLKAYNYFIDAAGLAAPQNPHLRFRLVGDGTLRPALERQLADSGLGDRFEMPGWAEHALAEIERMDIYLVSSVTDTTNLTVLEAMGLGKPVIATAVGGIPDAVKDGANGFVVAPRRPDLLANRMLMLAGDAELRERMGREGRRRFEETFMVERMVMRHREVYEGLA